MDFNNSKQLQLNKIYQGESLTILKTFPNEGINCCVTSPPYWGLRDYGYSEQIGLQTNIDDYINNLCNIFDEVKRTLKKDGTLWVNIGDSYHNATKWTYKDNSQTIANGNSRNFPNGKKKNQNLPEKCLCMIPFRFAMEMVNRGWILRNTIIWEKPNCMPESVKDRFTVDFQYIFFFVKNKKYYFEQQFEPIKIESIKRKLRGTNINKYSDDKHLPQNVHSQKLSQPRKNKGYGELDEIIKNSKGRNKRTTWQINTKSFKGAHFATFPLQLIQTPIKAGCPEGGVILDPFFGSGTTGVVALKQNKYYIGIELNSKYVEIATQRIKQFIK